MYQFEGKMYACVCAGEFLVMNSIISSAARVQFSWHWNTTCGRSWSSWYRLLSEHLRLLCWWICDRRGL